MPESKNYTGKILTLLLCCFLHLCTVRIGLLKYLKENGVFANIGVTELEAQKALKQRTDNMFTLKDN